MKKSLLKKYAELLVRSGIALKRGQSVRIVARLEIEEFTAMVVEECYKRGAKRVVVSWQSDLVTRAEMKRGKKENLAKVLPMEEAMEKWLTDDLPCLLWLDSDDPDGMAGLDVSKFAYIRQEKFKVLGHYRTERENKYQWCIAGVPGVKWAQKVFPEEKSKKKAVEKLWQAILETSRAADGNGIKNWEAHDLDLKKRCDYLNSLKLKSLHYTSSNGTDLTVGLIPGVIFLGGGETNLGGVFYQPNIPSEECFTSPMKGEAEGIVYSAKPLSYNGVLIENFWVRFEKGKAVEVHAEKGEEALASILTLDEGSAYLGECALVPYDSPINNTGLLFYNTLFDENAACHLALGRGFTMLYPEFEKYSEEELLAKGINKSLSHVDFMIGSKDLSIVGTTVDGKEVAIFKDGNWAF
ncbi:MAG: aminopeptidase [Bacillota bacterium]|nr:aminopeptidase [Bacillota bacterium]